MNRNEVHAKVNDKVKGVHTVLATVFSNRGFFEWGVIKGALCNPSWFQHDFIFVLN